MYLGKKQENVITIIIVLVNSCFKRIRSTAQVGPFHFKNKLSYVLRMQQIPYLLDP